ncbi:TPA: hypothetical protein ACGR4R_003632, partial [Aeromonas veronii]
ASKAEISAAVAEKVPTQMGIFLPEIQYSSFFCCRCGEPSTTSYCATLPLRSFFILLFRDCSTATDFTPVHRDAAYMNASNKKGRPRPARKDAQGAT